MSEATHGGTPSDDPRTKLLETSYKEILDATKHQDDKIGRILTGIAFLTAAALAFANQSGVGITTRHDLVDRRLPLLAYAVGAFVIGVVFTVIMLLSSLTTGLTLPGSKAPTAWTPDDERSSLIYFYSIARLPKHVWQERWNGSPVTLRDDLNADYVNETFNLAQRTNHKYTRTNEAVAVLSFTLFALGVAFVLAASIAATAGSADRVVRMTSEGRAALASFVGSYVAVQVLVARREHLLRLRTRGESRSNDRKRFAEFKTYQFALPALAAALVFPGRPALARSPAAAVAASALVAIGVVLLRREGGGVVVRLGALLVASVVIGAAYVPREETWRLLVAAGVPLTLTLRNLLEHTRRSRPPAA